MPAAQSALVIGGGIAGPVAATALVMAGIDATVYEARPASATDGIGGSLALEPNGLAALRIVGADDAVRAAALPDHAVRHVDRQQARPGSARPHKGYRRVSSSTAVSCTASCGTAQRVPECESTTARS